MTLLAYWTIAWIIGIWLSSLLAFPLYVWVGGALGALLAAVLTRPYETRLFFSCVFALALGGSRLILAEPQFDARSLATYNGIGEVTLTGVVADEPDVRGSFVFYKLDADALVFQDSEEPVSVEGATRVRGPRYPVYGYGDRLQVHGNLETPPVLEDFNYRDYLAHKGLHSQISYARIERLSSGEGSVWKRAMLDFKGDAQATIGHILPEPEASLLTGILLGNEGGIPPDVKDEFKTTGTSHVIAISGFNITIVIVLLMATVGWIVPDRRLAAAIAIIGVVAYTLFVGADAAVVRAAIMGIIVVFGVIVGRKGVAYNSLAAAIIVMTALNPYVLWDAGFQLSVAATLGLVVYGERFERAAQGVLERRLSTERATWVIKWMSEMLLLTLAAQILVTPLIVKHFGQLSLISLLSNALVLPIQPLVMFTGGAATLAGLAYEPLGQILGWGAYLPLTWTIRVVQWTADFPYASIFLTLSDAGLVVLYGVIVALTVIAFLSPDKRRALWQSAQTRFPQKAAMGGMALATVVAWFMVLQLPDDKLKVTFLDVGQGDSILIETPGGVQILVDGGPEGSALLSILGRQLPFWDRTLDLVVLTHPDEDHLTGLVAALERYGVRAVIVREQYLENDLVDAWEMSLATEGATLIGGEAGTRIELSDGVTLEILHPGPGPVADGTGSANNDSIVMRLVYGDVAFLLTGDIEATVEKELVRSGAYLRSSVLKLPHHGSNTSSSRAFLDAVRPQVAVISVGSDNDFGHPSREVLERLGKDTLVYRTDQNGSVTVTSDGRRLWIEPER